MGTLLKTKKTKIISCDPVLGCEGELLVLAERKMGGIDWQKRCTDTSSRLLSSLSFCSCEGEAEEEPVMYFHVLSLKPKGKDTYPGSQRAGPLYTASESIILLLFDLKRP